MKELIKNLRDINPNVDIYIFRSTYNVNLNTIISYTDGEKVTHFLDCYEDDKNKKAKKREEKKNDK